MRSSYFLATLYLFFLMEDSPSQSQALVCGSRLPDPEFSALQQHLLDSQVQVAKQHYHQAPQNADALIWYARRLGYLAHYEEAIDVFTKGIQQRPNDARMYRHRGHRYLTLRCIDKAIADFEKAAGLVAGKADETEPDGQPNEANIPTSTLHSNIYYHLGLAYYLKKDFSKAAMAYKSCLEVSANPDMYTATANWYYLTLRRMGKDREADNLIGTVDFNVPLLENGVYRKLLLLHKEKPSAAEAIHMAAGGSDVQSATFLYGLQMYLWLQGHRLESEQVKRQLLSGNQYASFGYIAAERE